MFTFLICPDIPDGSDLDANHYYRGRISVDERFTRILYRESIAPGG